MMHSKRPHKVTAIGGSARELVDFVCRSTWTLCTGFRWRGLVLLNDSTSEDGAMEFGVLRRADKDVDAYVQVESITFGWLNSDDAKASTAEYLEALDVGTKPGVPSGVTNINPHPEGSCYACA